MVKCPKCGEEIDFLENFSKCEEKYRFTVGDDGIGSYDFEACWKAIKQPKKN